VDPGVIEEREREHDPLLAIDRDESTVAAPRHDASDARLELLLARDPGAGPGKAVDSSLESHAVDSERVIPLAVVVLEAGEVVVGGRDELRARHALCLRNALREDRMRRARGLDAFSSRREVAPAAVHARRPNSELLDFRDATVGNSEPQRERDEVAVVGTRAVLSDGADEGDLLSLDVRNVELVVADPRHRIPESFVAQRQ